MGRLARFSEISALLFVPFFFLVCRSKNQLRDYMTTEPARLAGILVSVLIKNYPVDIVNRPSDNGPEVLLFTFSRFQNNIQ